MSPRLLPFEKTPDPLERYLFRGVAEFPPEIGSGFTASPPEKDLVPPSTRLVPGYLILEV